MTSLKPSLVQTGQLRQEFRINPRLYQAMELLHMPLLDLQQRLKAEMAENPFLELAETEDFLEVSLDEVAASEEQEGREEDEVDWEEILLDGFDTGGYRGQAEELSFRERPQAEAADLRTKLLEQLYHLSIPEREIRLGEEIIGNVDDSGLLTCTLDEVVDGANAWLADVRGVAEERALENGDETEREKELAEVGVLFRDYSTPEAERMLKVIQTLDPPGVAARDLRECILLQLTALGAEDSLAHTLVTDHFDDFLNRRWNEIARELGVTPKAVQDAADAVAKLDPKPGLRHAPDDESYILPDLIVEKIDGEYHVFLNDGNLPRLRISRAYREVARDRRKFTGANREFITTKLHAANWMIQAIEQRRQTMLRVMNFIVERQHDFLEKGVQHLRPLTLREVADHIEMHESTVSRVTNAKYVQTPRGVYPLKYFFSSGLQTSSGKDISARGVKDKIRTLVSQEDAKKPLTDQRIAELLDLDGVRIARRTVAKYRGQLGILSARMRRRV